MGQRAQIQNSTGRLGLRLGLLIFLLPLIQNCSPVAFNAKVEMNSVTASEVPAPATPTPTPAPTCPDGQVFDGQSCIVPATGCTKQIRLEPVNGLVSIPQRDLHGTCYYVKLFTARPSGAQPGDENLPFAADVVAADHDQPSYAENGLRFYSERKNPLVLGGREFDLTIEGSWNVFISSDSSETKNLFVDNFILLEVTNPSGIALWLRGTRDIFPKLPGAAMQEPIQIGSQNVSVSDASFSGMAQGGTETVASVSITHLFTPMRRLGFRSRALDCGAGKAMSDVWLLFKP